MFEQLFSFPILKYIVLQKNSRKFQKFDRKFSVSLSQNIFHSTNFPQLHMVWWILQFPISNLFFIHPTRNLSPSPPPMFGGKKKKSTSLLSKLGIIFSLKCMCKPMAGAFNKKTSTKTPITKQHFLPIWIYFSFTKLELLRWNVFCVQFCDIAEVAIVHKLI